MDVVDEVLQSDLGPRSDDADCSYEATTRRGLLSAEHVLDTSANPALLSVGVLFPSVARSIGMWHAVVQCKTTVDLEVDAGYETAEAIRKKRHCHVCDLVWPADPAQRRRARVRFIQGGGVFPQSYLARSNSREFRKGRNSRQVACSTFATRILLPHNAPQAQGSEFRACREVMNSIRPRISFVRMCSPTSRPRRHAAITLTAIILLQSSSGALTSVRPQCGGLAQWISSDTLPNRSIAASKIR